MNAKRLQKPVNQPLRAAVERDRVDHAVARLQAGQQGGHDRSHAGIKDDGPLGAILERDHLIFEDLGVRVVEA